jgi:hypothetical protein
MTQYRIRCTKKGVTCDTTPYNELSEAENKVAELVKLINNASPGKVTGDDFEVLPIREN